MSRYAWRLAGTSVGSLFLTPLLAYAAPASFFGPIISTGCQCPTAAPDFGCVLQTIQNIMNLGITFAVTIAIVFIAYSGILFMTSAASPGNREKARTLLLNVIVGMVVVLGAWVIVDFVMKNLYNENSQFGPWNQIISGGNQCFTAKTLQPITDGGVVAVVTGSGVNTGSSNTGATNANTASGNEDAVRAQLAAAGVSINHAACPTRSDGQGCTNVGGLQSATIQQAITISQAMGGGLMITGGSEPGHASGTYSHGNGYKLDLHPTSALDSLLQSLTSVGTRTGDSPGPAYTDSCGNQYVRESDHWDITIKASCSLK